MTITTISSPRTVVGGKEDSTEKVPCDVIDATVQPKQIVSPVNDVKDGKYFLNVSSVSANFNIKRSIKELH